MLVRGVMVRNTESNRKPGRRQAKPNHNPSSGSLATFRKAVNFCRASDLLKFQRVSLAQSPNHGGN